MTKAHNLTATIRMILADKNSSFYQAYTKPTVVVINKAGIEVERYLVPKKSVSVELIESGKKISEAFCELGKSAQQTSDEMRSFTDYIDSWKQTIYSAFDCSKYIRIPRRNGKSFTVNVCNSAISINDNPALAITTKQQQTITKAIENAKRINHG